jgi:hypothetical protein
MRHSLIASALLFGLLAAIPAHAQSTATTTTQNSAEAGGSIGAAGHPGTAARPPAGTPVVGNSHPNAPHTGVSGEAAAAGGAR